MANQAWSRIIFEIFSNTNVIGYSHQIQIDNLNTLNSHILHYIIFHLAQPAVFELNKSEDQLICNNMLII